MADRAIRMRLHGVDVWLRESTLANGHGPLMSTPTHDKGFPPKVSYAHLHPDGVICRYRQVIGSRDDLTPVEEN